jgi:hypothetical protein
LIESLHIKNPELLTYVIHAIGNAGSTVIPPKYMQLVTPYLKHSSSFVRKAASLTLEKYHISFSWEDSNFPFNKTYNYDVKLGGATVNADFDVELFAGFYTIPGKF